MLSFTIHMYILCKPSSLHNKISTKKDDCFPSYGQTNICSEREIHRDGETDIVKNSKRERERSYGWCILSEYQ